MRIHIKKPSERLMEIAEEYSVSEDNIRKINEISEGEPADGEELLILVPTRSYTVQYGDTPERIAIRFGIKRSYIFSLNPWVEDEGLREGNNISLKYGEKPCGMAVANGYLYKGCTQGQLLRVMPYLTYVTFAAGIADERGVRRATDFKREIELVKRARKIPLIRVYDRYAERYKRGGDLTQFAESLIALAIDGGYKGLVLDSCTLDNSAEEFTAFLLVLRKMMIGCDLILITEINENSPMEFSEFADGSVMYYPKYAIDNPPSFADGERRILADFACRGESAKTFIDLPSLARRGKEFVSVGELMRNVRRHRWSIESNENTLLSHTGDKKQGDYIYSSLEGIKSILELIGELDYMGICFDIMRTPLSHLMMYNSMFKTSYYSNVRTREGCSHADEE